ncbi:MAG: TatD family hydrolase [Rhodospirillales bacterium]|nr:TatD family hydrolase [Rhodospirillales bacterium]
MLVDSHCHLDFPDFDNERDAVVARAMDAGIGYMVTICTHMSKFDAVHAVAATYANMSCTVGVHPHNAGEEGALASVDALCAIANKPKVIGIGETGLDYFYEHSPRAAQKQSFLAHIEASRRTGLPLIVHTRDADDDTVEMLRDEYQKGPFPGLIHCFSAGPELAWAVLELGFYISISGIVTFKSAQALRDTVANVPIERILVETDSPYLAPIPMRGRRNEPAFTAHTAAVVADIKGVSAQQLATQTTDNFFNLFAKADRETATCG